jgi:hypothetical protein
MLFKQLYTNERMIKDSKASNNFYFTYGTVLELILKLFHHNKINN